MAEKEIKKESKKDETPKKEVKHESIIKVKDLKKEFHVGKNLISALRGVDFNVFASSFTIIFGPSGCGKSTLLNIIAGIDTPSSGDVVIRDTNIFKLNEDDRGEFRSKKMGIVHQMSYWIKSLNVLENVALPLVIEGRPMDQAVKRAREVMSDIGINNLEKQLPTQLSGGQQQKAGVARALVSNPWILMADEPTGNLDSTSSDEIMALFDMLNKKYRRTIIMVTHNQAYWSLGTRRVEMRDGQIIEDVTHG